MIKVSREVRSGAARFAVSVRAGSVRRATNLVGGRYPDAGARSPVNQEGSIDHAARVGTVAGLEMAA